MATEEQEREEQEHSISTTAENVIASKESANLRDRSKKHISSDESFKDSPAQEAAAIPKVTGTAAEKAKHHVLGAKEFVTSRVQEYYKEPSKIAHFIKSQLDHHVGSRFLIIFCVVWAPIWIMVAGSGLGQMLRLLIQNLHYFVGLGAAGYVWTLLHGNQSFQQKFLQLFLITTAAPVIILDIGNPFLKLITILAFSGAPFIFSLLYSVEKTGEKEDLSKTTGDERLIEFGAATGAIFALSILPGDNSLFHHVFLAAILAAAAFVTHKFFPANLSFIPEKHKELSLDHQVVILAAVELLLGNLILLILSFVLPQDVLDNEHSIGAVLLYTLLGLAFLAGGNILSSNFLEKLKMPEKTVLLITKIGIFAIVASYALLLFAFVPAYSGEAQPAASTS